MSLINGIEKELVIANNCSTDQTAATIRDYIRTNPSLDIRYFEHSINQGKGAALYTGIQQAMGEWIIVQDADLEYDPREYNALLKLMVGAMPMWYLVRGLWVVNITGFYSFGIRLGIGSLRFYQIWLQGLT